MLDPNAWYMHKECGTVDKGANWQIAIDAQIKEFKSEGYKPEELKEANVVPPSQEGAESDLFEVKWNPAFGLLNKRRHAGWIAIDQEFETMVVPNDH